MQFLITSFKFGSGSGNRPFAAIDHVVNLPVARRLWWASKPNIRDDTTDEEGKRDYSKTVY